jgi:hypothetical protein
MDTLFNAYVGERNGFKVRKIAVGGRNAISTFAGEFYSVFLFFFFYLYFFFRSGTGVSGAGTLGKATSSAMGQVYQICGDTSLNLFITQADVSVIRMVNVNTGNSLSFTFII